MFTNLVLYELYRAEIVISNPTNVKPENDHIIRNALEGCGYPICAFEKANVKDTKITGQSTGTSKRDTLVTIPYCAGLSERFKNIYKSYGISTAFKLFLAN